MVFIRKIGSPADCRVALYSDSGGNPDASIEFATVSSTVEYETEAVTINLTQALTSGTAYHIVVGDFEEAWDTDNYYEILDTNLSAGVYHRYTSSSWATWARGPLFRITDARDDFKGHFFMYMGIPHVVLAYDDDGIPQIYRNGEIGQVARSTANTLTDTGKSWTTNEWAGAQVELWDGKGSEALNRFYTVASNTANVLTFDRNFDVQPLMNRTYYNMTGTNIWKLAASLITAGPVTDVYSFQNLAYIMRGDLQDAHVLRFIGISGGSLSPLYGTRGTYMTSANDSYGDIKLWKVNRDLVASLVKSDAPWGSYGSMSADLDWGYDFTIPNGDMELDATWTAVGTPTTEEQSTEQAWYSTYSWKLVCDADEEGITQTLTLVSGDQYRIGAAIYIVSGSANGVKLMAGGEEIGSIDTTTTDEWVWLNGYRTAASASETIQILSDGGAASFYVDNVYGEHLPTTVPSYGHSGKATNLVRYGEPERLWLMTEAGLFMEDNGKLLPIPLQELAHATDPRNGIALIVHDVYLFFSFHNSFERYYKSNLDDVGPTRDEGLPDGRQGAIVDAASYPGRIYTAIDSGINNISSALLYNNLGWHEVYRAPGASSNTTEQRIQGIATQSVPGVKIDRLWMSCGSDLVGVPVDLNPTTNSNYRYTHEGVIETARLYYNKHDVDKFWKSIKLVVDCDYIQWDIDVLYQVDNETTWTYVGNISVSAITDDPSHSLDISSTNDVTGKGIKFKLVMRTADPTNTPEIKALVVDFIEQVPIKRSWSFTFLAEDSSTSLLGSPNYDKAETIIEQLETWEGEPDPATIESNSSLLSNAMYKILEITYQHIIPPDATDEKLLCTMRIVET